MAKGLIALMQRGQIVGYAKGSFLDTLNAMQPKHGNVVPKGGLQEMLNQLYREVAGKKK